MKQTKVVKLKLCRSVQDGKYLYDMMYRDMLRAYEIVYAKTSENALFRKIQTTEKSYQKALSQ